MKMIFDDWDRDAVAHILEDDGLYVDDKRVADVLYNVEAAFQQQLPDEIKYMINEFEDLGVI